MTSSSSGPGNSCHYSFKILLIGDTGVGKSSLLVSFISNHLVDLDLSPTIGVDFKIKHLTIADKKLKLTIWDTAVRVQPTGINADDYVKSLDVWETDNAKIIIWINNSVSHSIGAQLAKYETTKEVWEHLARLYTQSNFAKQYQLEANIGLRGTILHRSPLPSVDSVVHELLAKEIRLKSQVDKRIVAPSTPSVFAAPQRSMPHNQTGQERFRTLTTSYYRGSQGIILVYDVTKRDTFTNIADVWIKEIELYATNHNCVKVLVGNKADKESERMVTSEEGMAFANEYKCLFLECSAKTRSNVERCFEELALKILEVPELLEEGSAPAKRNILKQKQDQRANHQGGCCS
ncbi:hypothetical protein ZIOFF_023020 [Zingiber officinale]|uniref:Uncharacterized protein n=1 Tax=Zingiber officinale TaxID=94328 RepID=A0A8J5L9L4_ZINOF|nr:hypothetical protein ZIOFF_023020 [Zingiber officinale]